MEKRVGSEGSVIYYVVANKHGFEEMVFQGTYEEAEQEKVLREADNVSRNETPLEPWFQTRYYVIPETEWPRECGGMH